MDPGESSFKDGSRRIRVGGKGEYSQKVAEPLGRFALQVAVGSDLVEVLPPALYDLRGTATVFWGEVKFLQSWRQLS